MKKKIILILIMLFICAGCKAKYNISISEDGSVYETAVLTEDEEFFENYEHSSVGRVIGFIAEPYLDKLNSNGYEINSSIGKSESGAIVKRKFNSVEEYTKNTILSSQFSSDKMKYEEDGNKVTLSIKGNFSKGTQDQERVAVDEATVSITIPYKVKESNADKVSGETYTWVFNKDDDDEREIKLVYDKSKVKGDFSLVTTITVIVIIVVLLLGSFIVYRNFNKKKNSVNKI